MVLDSSLAIIIIVIIITTATFLVLANIQHRFQKPCKKMVMKELRFSILDYSKKKKSTPTGKTPTMKKSTPTGKTPAMKKSTPTGSCA